MNKEEARGLLWDHQKESPLESEGLFNAIVSCIAAGTIEGFRYNEAMDEIIVGGETHGPDGEPLDDPAPTIRYLRPK